MRARLYLTLLVAGCSYTSPGPGPGPGDTDAPGPDPDAAPISGGLRKAITIDGTKVTGTLTNFPVWVDLMDAELKTGAQPDGSDLFFADAAGVPLPYELRSWSSMSGRLTAFVRIGSLTQNQDATFYLRYGGDAAPPQDPATVFSAYAAVWHLDDTLADPSVADAKGVANGTATGMDADRQKAGKLGGSFDFDGINMLVNFDNMVTGNTSSTISAWVSQRNALGMDAIVTLGNSSQNQSRFLYGVYGGNHVGAGLYGNDWNDSGTDIRNDGFTLLHWTLDGATGTSTLYRDGGSPQTHAFGTTIATTNTTGAGWLGFAPAAWGNNHLNGLLDEVRIARTVLPAEWVRTEFENQERTATFFEVGAAEQAP